MTTNVTEFRGVAAGAFNANSWEHGKLHWVPDLRSPLLEPKPGAFRNIYAPSVVYRHGSWDIYFGGWDGVATGNDRIYHTSTTDFLKFGERRTVIEHGEFQHVCNVSAVSIGETGTAMLCTGYPDSNGRNKPVFFSSPDGVTWNGKPVPYRSTPGNIVTLSGYSNYSNADINGMNVLFHDDSSYRMYFADFQNFGEVFRASASDGTSFTMDGIALAKGIAPNDVKRFANSDGATTYLMGLHMNTGLTWYATSRDGLTFRPMREMFRPTGKSDAYIVAVGFVTSEVTHNSSHRLLGVLYGAGAVPSLDRNRIFARWLQKRIIININTGDQVVEPQHSYGPDRAILESTPAGESHIQVSSEDGTVLAETSATLQQGKAYQLLLSRD